MEHNLDDSLNLDSAMRVDFEQPEETVCHQSDIILDQEDIPMEFVYEEKPMLMDTDGEEIIISDLIGGQFNLQDLQNEQNELGVLNEVEPSYNLTTQSDTMLDLQLNQQIVTSAQDPSQQNFITVQTSPRKKVDSTIPRPVAIAPKPPTLAPKLYRKPLNIAPKPVTFVANKNFINKSTLTVPYPGNTKGNNIIAQIGKQLLMMPANTQKIKLVATSQANAPTIQKVVRSDPSQVQILPAKNATQGQHMKIITLQGQSSVIPDTKPPVITKLMPAKPHGPARYVTVQQNKSVPLAVGNKVIMASPTKQALRLAKKQEIISLKPVAKLLPKVSPANKLLISSANSTQNVILKTTAPPTKVSKVEAAETSRTQIHQINVPGKGIQYIRLVTNSGTAPTKTAIKQPQKIITVPSKSIMVADAKAMDTKPPKLVRIAPMKTSQTPASVRSSQSLLAPISAVTEFKSDPSEEVVVNMEAYTQDDPELDSKDQLKTLIENSMGDDAGVNHEVTMDFKKQLSSDEEEETTQQNSVGEERPEEHPLIVIPSNFEHSLDVQKDYSKSDASQNMNMNVLKEENDSMNTFEDTTYSFTDQGNVVTALETTELGLRPRKACNCTKSQCLKLYCDCFANGEFCNQCNCNNCYNNLQNEELRQKAIRGCLDRNPHAFKPKIGKSKIGGPEIIRRHNKGCNCKRSGCLKNYCECYEARIACTAMCKCVGCRNVTDCMEQGRLERVTRPTHGLNRTLATGQTKQPCTFVTTDVIEAVCQCLVAAAEGGERERDRCALGGEGDVDVDPVRDVIDEFARCLQDIIAAAHAGPITHDESPA